MDDEAKQLLREIRDTVVEEAISRKRFIRAVWVVIAALLCLVGVLTFRLFGLMDQVEREPQPPAAARQG